MISPDKLREIRDALIDLIEDPMHGFGGDIDDRGLNLNDMTAEFVLPMGADRYEVTIKWLP